MDKKISISQIKEVVQQAYEQVKGNTGGKNADYIPYLANIDKNLFGISVCLLNGQTITVGDFDYRFGIESVSKVHTAILILRQYGAQKVLEMIGADATGLPFNSIIAILLENDHPSTPLVNAGAISACSTHPVRHPELRYLPPAPQRTDPELPGTFRRSHGFHGTQTPGADCWIPPNAQGVVPVRYLPAG